MTTSDVLTRAIAGMNVAVPPLAEVIGMSRSGLYKAVMRGEVASVKVGCAILIPAHEARRLLGMKPETAPIAA